MSYLIKMHYIGGILSKNKSKTFSRRGFNPVVKEWMKILSDKAGLLEVPKDRINYQILLNAYFSDKRYPDLANLHEVIGDSLKIGLNIDDKKFLFHDNRVEIGFMNPYLLIEIIPNLEVECPNGCTQHLLMKRLKKLSLI